MGHQGNLAKKETPANEAGAFFRRFASCLSVDHLGARHIAFLIQVIEIAFLFLQADFLDFLRPAAFLAAASHLGPGDIALLVDVIKEARRATNASLLNFLSHFLFDLRKYTRDRKPYPFCWQKLYNISDGMARDVRRSTGRATFSGTARFVVPRDA